MPIEVAPCTGREELVQALGAIWHYFGVEMTPADVERYQVLLGPDRMFAARVDGAIVGSAGAYRHELTVPGGTVDAAGVTLVGVLPTHRRRGVLRALMRAQLDSLHAAGTPVAHLWASEETIYGRFGYGIATLCGEVDVEKVSGQFAEHCEFRGRVALLGLEEAIEPLRQVHDAVRRATPGMFVRSEEWWRRRRLADPDSRRGGGGPMQRAVLSMDGRPAAYALYRMHPSIDAGITHGHVTVIEALGIDPQATREIWRFLLDVDWTARLKASLLPIDHPLFFLLARPRQLRFQALDGLWVRLVDLPAALRSRRLGGGAPLVIEVRDEFCAWNHGRFRISAEGVERTQLSADLACDVSALGSVYLGGFTFRQLVRSGRVEERTPGAGLRGDGWFPGDGQPWCPEIF